MLFLFVKIPKSVTQSSPLLKENWIDKFKIKLTRFNFCWNFPYFNTLIFIAFEE